jgi:hypothetical protein
MSDAASFPYATHLNVLFAPLEKIALDPLVAAVRDQWYNQTLARINDSVVRLGVMQGSTTGTSTKPTMSSSMSSTGASSSTSSRRPMGKRPGVSWSSGRARASSSPRGSCIARGRRSVR